MADRLGIKGKKLLVAILASTAIPFATKPAISADPFKLEVEQKGYRQDNTGGKTSYPAPKLIPEAGTSNQYQGNVRNSAPLSGGASTQMAAPLKSSVSVSVALPANFLGVWYVEGQRTKVEALSPDYQQGAESAFAINTSNIWEIAGNAETGYTMGSNTGIKTQIVVDKVQGNTAFIRYQHPINRTMAQEAIVMYLNPGARQFNALERISIVKDNSPPRARVTYQLIGRRQR